MSGGAWPTNTISWRIRNLATGIITLKKFTEFDKFDRLIGIHNGVRFYDHTNPLVTHASIQNEETFRAKEYRIRYKKPVVYDECRYEGTIPWSWGNLTAKAMTEKFWRGFTNGGYVGHGETYVTENPAGVFK